MCLYQFLLIIWQCIGDIRLYFIFTQYYQCFNLHFAFSEPFNASFYISCFSYFFNLWQRIQISHFINAAYIKFEDLKIFTYKKRRMPFLLTICLWIYRAHVYSLKKDNRICMSCLFCSLCYILDKMMKGNVLYCSTVFFLFLSDRKLKKENGLRYRSALLSALLSISTQPQVLDVFYFCVSRKHTVIG